MSLFRKKRPEERVGVLIEIGSGSAAVSLLISTPDKIEPTVVWSSREDAVLKHIGSLEEGSKTVMTALMNVLLDFETTGRQALRQAGKSTIDAVQCVVAAPWSHTVPKRIEYKQDESFVVTQELIDELVNMAITKTKEDINEESLSVSHGLAVASRATLHVLLNGYRTAKPTHQSGRELILLHTTVVVHDAILQAIEEIRQKMFPSCSLEIYSSALVLHCVANDIAPQHTNLTLLDITHEASELSVVRDGELTHVAFAPFGVYTIAREYATIMNVPLSEALGYLKADAEDRLSHASKSTLRDIDKVHEAYVEKITQLLQDTGDELVSPRQIVLHVDALFEDFFVSILQTASKRSIKSDPVITKASTTILRNVPKSDMASIGDTAVLAGMHFFHTGNQCITITHE